MTETEPVKTLKVFEVDEFLRKQYLRWIDTHPDTPLLTGVKSILDNFILDNFICGIVPSLELDPRTSQEIYDHISDFIHSLIGHNIRYDSLLSIRTLLIESSPKPIVVDKKNTWGTLSQKLFNTSLSYQINELKRKISRLGFSLDPRNIPFYRLRDEEELHDLELSDLDSNLLYYIVSAHIETQERKLAVKMDFTLDDDFVVLEDFLQALAANQKK